MIKFLRQGAPEPVFFSPRKDYGQEWDGSILIDGLNIKVSKSANLYKLYVIKFVNLSYDPGRSIAWPSSIVVRNVFIDGTFNTNKEFFQAIMVSLNPVIATQDVNRKILCPNTLVVSDVFFIIHRCHHLQQLLHGLVSQIVKL